MTNKLKGLFSSHIFFFLFFSTVILSLNVAPLAAHILHSPPGRSFALIHNNVQDFFFYQALMNEGANGAWLTTDPYTTEPHQSSTILAYFVWLGKLSKIFSLPHAFIYHLARIVLGIFLLFAVYYLLFAVGIPYPRLAFLFFIFAAPFMTQDRAYMNWWTGMDPIRRIAYLPHHVFGGLFLTISIILTLKFFQKTKIKYFALLLVSFLLLSFIHPPSLFIILLVLPSSLLFYYLINRNNLKTNPAFLGGLSFLWIIGFISLILIVAQTNKGFPWNQILAWEKNTQSPLTPEVIPALGILFPISVIGVFYAITSKKFRYLFMACWLFVPLFLTLLIPLPVIPKIRLIQGMPYLPLAILAILGIKKILDFLFSRKIIPAEKERVALALVLLMFTISTLPTLSWSLKSQIKEYWPIFGNVYLDNRLYKAFSFINKKVPPKSKTLSTFYSGNYLPAYTNTVSFIGHSAYTYNLSEKEKLVSKFFKNEMTSQEVEELLLNNNITLVFQGPEEKPIYSGYLYPKLLKPIYDQKPVTLYVLKSRESP